MPNITCSTSARLGRKASQSKTRRPGACGPLGVRGEILWAFRTWPLFRAASWKGGPTPTSPKDFTPNPERVASPRMTNWYPDWPFYSCSMPGPARGGDPTKTVRNRCLKGANCHKWKSECPVHPRSLRRHTATASRSDHAKSTSFEQKWLRTVDRFPAKLGPRTLQNGPG